MMSSWACEISAAAVCAHCPAMEAHMVKFEVTSEEAEKLRSILDDYLSDLRMEIVDTENHDFRVMLKERKDLVERLLGQLKEQHI
jgi:predicted RNA binding protein with dsRBD fold (UPF0201 family)